ncbi:Manganese resistance protein MNR2 [Wickerhamomyces ciferrii]|uniref:Manganese resistance protein MNR2 n=1 Tax=Wickerhamomyces ciferrii (strain ATCC 14091 / BCRC 22168 / CBS 111 / JCM 3599 / NBRC 0793 / NRRL Y-1031 F-60-10) TaxID=1206466 RepID=K0KW30_WICCF|nr:Manganese resistance protein MNR2 [Wickerhamomyces ciferrii]CCH46187.1 Manganese resistance protein MNR2 [Wickerhamomyces ciferrii]
MSYRSRSSHEEQEDTEPLLSQSQEAKKQSYFPSTSPSPKEQVSKSPKSHTSNHHHHHHQPHQPHQRRRLTFSGPSGKPTFNFNAHDAASEYEVDALGKSASRSSSVGHHLAEFGNPVRDLTSYDPRNLPSSKLGKRSSISTRPNKDRMKTSASTENANPFNKYASGFNQPHSPSYAERWINKQQSQFHSYGAINSGSSSSAANPVSIDIDQLNHDEQDQQHMNSHDHDSDFDSKPSSRRSSESSSLADVCFPLDPIDDIEGERLWPDLQVLEEFYEEETSRLKDEAMRETDEVNFRFQDSADDNISSNPPDSQGGEGVGFTHPMVTKVDAPRMLGNQRINETETLDGGRLRPPKINPFDRKRLNNTEFLKTINYPPQIVNNNPEHFRFTYFRENLDSTVHSPTISGLLQPGQNFSDLFLSSEYRKQDAANIVGGAGTGSNTNNNSTSTSVKESTPGLSDLKVLEESLEIDDHTSPFWLDVLNPTEEEMKVISKAFSIHPLTTEDIFLGETREKVELFKDYYFICFRSFDIVHEKAKIRERLNEIKSEAQNKNSGFFNKLFNRRQSSTHSRSGKKSGDRHKPKGGELEPLNVYILVFRNAVLTFHFAPTPHPVNVRRRARLLREYLTVTADWIAYALIDDITDAFGPMIESIEDEVNAIEDSILTMNESSDEEDDSSDEEDDFKWTARSIMSKKSRRDSTRFDDKRSIKSISSSSSRSTASNVIEWKKKGDMLKRIGECRKRVMSLLRLLGSKADVIKGFAKRCNEQWEVAPRSEIGMYLGDIQDHIVTMVQSLNHYEKLLARSHSNYLAQINIDMTRVNNDMNDVLGKISILGTVVLPMNVVTGLWGMNVLVPGQEYEGLAWFWSLAAGMFAFAFCCYMYAKKISGIA